MGGFSEYPDRHGEWVAALYVGEPGSKYSTIYECACGCGDTWQPEYSPETKAEGAQNE